MKINTSLPRRLAAMLVVIMSVQAPFARAELVSTDDMTAQNTAEQDRAKIHNFLERANVKERLQAMGVNGVLAEDRVASLSEQEVHALAQRIDSMPAGGNISNMELVIILLLVILVAIVV